MYGDGYMMSINLSSVNILTRQLRTVNQAIDIYIIFIEKVLYLKIV